MVCSRCAVSQGCVCHQEEVYDRCRGVWPERFKHGYAHYDGPFMEEYFFRKWTAARPALPQVRQGSGSSVRTAHNDVVLRRVPRSASM